MSEQLLQLRSNKENGCFHLNCPKLAIELFRLKIFGHSFSKSGLATLKSNVLPKDHIWASQPYFFLLTYSRSAWYSIIY